MIKKLGLAGLIFLSTLGQVRSDGGEVEKSSNTKNVATGTFLVEPEPFELPSFAHIDIYLGKDTLSLPTGPIPNKHFSLPADSTTKYTVHLRPGTEYNGKNQGDYFVPYKATVVLKPGENGIIKLRRESNYVAKE